MNAQVRGLEVRRTSGIVARGGPSARGSTRGCFPGSFVPYLFLASQCVSHTGRQVYLQECPDLGICATPMQTPSWPCDTRPSVMSNPRPELRRQASNGVWRGVIHRV
jgi:hypothetical protein